MRGLAHRRRFAVACAGLLTCAGLLACAARREQARGPAGAPATAVAESAACPEHAAAPEALPGARPEQRTLDYWLGRYDTPALDAPLLTAEEIAAYDARVGRRPGGHLFAQRNLLTRPDRVETERDVWGRLTALRTKLDAAQLVDNNAKPPAADAIAAFATPLPALEPVLHEALADVQLRCGPFAGPLHDAGSDRRYDRNACSAVRAHESVETLARWPNGMQLARTRYALGWLDADAPLSPPVPAAERAARLQRPPATRPLTRRALLTEAFALLDSRYGLGDAGGGRDCSRLLLDLFEKFGLALPRHSGWQAQAGNYRVDVASVPEAEKVRLIDSVARDAAVLLAFPGHIMLYLGKSTEGVPMALHALGEYVQPCAGGGETILALDHAVVSDLELGRGSSRKALIERITTIVALGHGPDAALAAHAHAIPPIATRPDPGAACEDSLDTRIFVSPRQPQVGRAVRVIATATQAPGDAQLWLWAPDGTPLDATLHRLGGPPYAQHLRVEAPVAGAWTAALARGTEILACRRFRVAAQAQLPTPLGADAVWTPRWSWERDTENLWSAFVEQLFDYPPDERTWTSLHALLRDPDRNLLHDHLGRGEDDKLEIAPDCADLPVTMRAYFAWKLALPHAYRQCSRGRSGRPPTCGELHSNLEPREADDDVDAFDIFVNRRVRSGAHSASGRTAPDDDLTDLYPVALDRASLAPGTVYADPYGHVMVVTGWIPQGSDPTSPYGVLMAAEAQPDSTVGRRRFWEGSFLFDPSTRDVGAGFKRFRPIMVDRDAVAGVVALTNEELAHTNAHPRFSRQQYEGTKEDFYEHVDALINPKPLAPAERMKSLVDAFDEAARRRVLSIDNGEDYVKKGGRMPIAMPVGYDIFETVGAWEDYATPSRDMRLLIAIDTVLALPERVRKRPERFGIAPENGAAEAERVRDALRADLTARRFNYTRSDGAAQTLTLEDLVDRQAALEVAYNPNDCPEVRWGAPKGSPERASCKRSAPADQRARMEKVRVWFHTRTRPARGAGEP